METSPTINVGDMSEGIWTKLIQRDPELTSWLQRIGQDYPYWTEVRRRAKPSGLSSQDAWILLKITRQTNLRPLRIATERGFQFSFQITESTLEKLHRFDLHLGGMLQSDSFIPAEDKNRYLVSSIMEEAIASSQLEGASTTREVAKEMLQKQRPPRDKSEQMILNSYQTIRFIREKEQEPMTVALLCQIQERMTQGTLRDSAHAGHIRLDESVEVWNEVAGEVVSVASGPP